MNLATTSRNSSSERIKRKHRQANKSAYAPKLKEMTSCVTHNGPVSDATLARITRRVLDELRTPGLIPSKVIRAALDETIALASLHYKKS